MEGKEFRVRYPLTGFTCSHCGSHIPITNVWIGRRSWIEQLIGYYPIEGFWCPKCGDPWTRCERIP